MKHFYLFSLLFLFAIQAFPQKYVKVWSDEFNTPGLPDSTKWDYEIGKVRNDELQYYTYKRSENARIQDTVLIIEARKEAYQGAAYTSASLKSRYKGDWLYGKFEIRAKVPTGKGTWPAIWMMPTDDEYGGWPKSGEIDIMEYVGMNPSNLYFTIHFEGTNGTGHQSSGANITFNQPYDRYITYTLIWSPAKLEWYADGVKYHTYNKTADDPRVWPFNKMFYFILNLAYGGSWGAQQGIDDSKLPHKFYIDYVRVYQLQESASPFSLNIEPATGGTVDVTPKLATYPEGTMVTVTANPDEKYEFDKWLHVGSANPMNIEISNNTNLIPVFKKKNELILNGDFTQGLKNWKNLYFYSANQAATPSVVDGQYIINVTKSGTANWHIVDQQLNIPLVQGATYQISFDAKADNPNSMNVFLSKNYGDYGGYYSTDKGISGAMQKFTWTVKMANPTDLNCRFGFGFGLFTGKVYLDNVSIAKMAVTSSDPLSNGDSEYVKIFPNPTYGSPDVTIETANLQLTGFDLYNFQGQIVCRISTDKSLPISQPLRLNLKEHHITKGIFFLSFSANGKKIVRKLVVN
jgi:beta-glucanase (GH16 family)